MSSDRLRSLKLTATAEQHRIAAAELRALGKKSDPSPADQLYVYERVLLGLPVAQKPRPVKSQRAKRAAALQADAINAVTRNGVGG